MELDIKNLEQQDMKALVRSLELVSARVFDSVVTTNQLASSTTPELRNLFEQWLTIIGRELARIAGETGRIDPDEIAKQIGITPESVLSLALTLHRRGLVRIKSLEVGPGDGKNKDICGCLAES